MLTGASPKPLPLTVMCASRPGFVICTDVILGVLVRMGAESLVTVKLMGVVPLKGPRQTPWASW